MYNPGYETIALLIVPGTREGPLLIGIFINAVLLGVMTTQVYLYFTTFKESVAVSDLLFLNLMA